MSFSALATPAGPARRPCSRGCPVTGRKTTAVKFISTRKAEMDTFTWSILAIMAVAAVGGALALLPSYLALSRRTSHSPLFLQGWLYSRVAAVVTFTGRSSSRYRTPVPCRGAKRLLSPTNRSRPSQAAGTCAAAAARRPIRRNDAPTERQRALLVPRRESGDRRGHRRVANHDRLRAFRMSSYSPLRAGFSTP